MESTTLKCVVCRNRPVNPMIGGIEPLFDKFGKMISGNRSYCSRICLNVNTRIDLQFTDADALARIANRIHEQNDGQV